MAGMAAARARGRLGGRPKLPDTDRKIQMASKLHGDPSNSISDICKTLGVSRATLYRYLSMSKTQSEPESK
jgi:DNA invertase Pin-like site-specific DNA recombinase